MVQFLDTSYVFYSKIYIKQNFFCASDGEIQHDDFINNINTSAA